MHQHLFFFFLLCMGCQNPKGDQPTDEESLEPADEPASEPTDEPASEPGTEPSDDWTELDAFIEDQMEEGNIPGLGIAIIANGEVALSKGYGWANIEDQTPVTGDTPFMLASISKVFTGTALMQTAEDGLISLDDPINDLLPYTVDNPKVEGEEILVRHLVTHSSSIRDRYSVWGELGDPGALYVYGDSEIPLGEFMMDYLSTDGELYQESNFLNSMPGEQYTYSNLATALAGQLVEEVSGTPLDDHSDLYIFGALGMTNTGWHLADHDPDLVAMPYSYAGSQYEAYGHFGYPDYPDGQLRSSAADLARFMLTYIQGGELDGQRILETDTISNMWEALLPDLEPTQGIFWYWDSYWGRDLIGHNGSDYGTATDMYYEPDTGVAIIVLCNTDWRNDSTAALDAIEEYLFEVGTEL